MNLFNNNNTQRPSTNLFANNPTPSGNTTQPSNTSTLPTSNNPFGQRQSTTQATTNLQNTSLPINQRSQNNQTQNSYKRHIIFKQLCKQIENNVSRAKILLEDEPTKRALSLSLQYFDKSTLKTQTYQKQHSRVQNFGLPVKNFGNQFKNFKCDKIDNIWRTIIQLASEISNANQVVLCEYLNRYLISKGIYERQLTCTEFSYGSYARVPNNSFLQSLYRNNYETNQIVVSIQHDFILQVLRQIFFQLYSQQLAMLRIISILQRENKKYFCTNIKKNQNQYFTVLWKKFKIYSELQIWNQIQGNEQRNKKIKQFYTNTKKFGMQKIIHDFKCKLKLEIGENLYNVINEYGSWEIQPTINRRIDYNQALKFIDQDLQYLVSKGQSLPLIQNSYIQVSLKLLLKIIPLRLLCSPKQKFNEKIQKNFDILKLRQKLRQFKSPFLEPFKFLEWVTNKKQRKKQQIQQKWNKIPKIVEWIMRNSIWSQWLGILLIENQSGDDLLASEALMNQIVKMMKIIVSTYHEEFWSDNSSYEFSFMRTFLKQFINRQAEDGIKIFLPVLTKSIEVNVSKTLDIISSNNHHKFIKQSLITNLQITDRHNSSMKLSMFNSMASRGEYLEVPEQNNAYRVFDTYPQQQLKFLCKMVIQCKHQLSLVQEKFFQCFSTSEPKESTGILVCKFLLQCLSRLRQYKVSSLKCMRYIMDALDALFVYEKTRPAFMIALSLALNSQDGENGRKQLYEMINFACSKPSASQEYRQSQKLKQILSNHICNIVRLSRYIHEYFPNKEDFRKESRLTQINRYIINKQYQQLYHWYSKNAYQVNYRVTNWLSSLLLVLQNDYLLPIDFETIRLLILKMQVDRNWKQQFDCMANIIQILNKSNIVTVMLDTLKPRIQTMKNIENQQLFMFKLQNQRYCQFRQLNNIKTINIASQNVYNQDQSLLELKRKQKVKIVREQQNILSSIAGTLQLISTLLYFKNSVPDMPQNMTQLFSMLNLYQQFTDYLTQKSKIYHYKVPIKIKRTIELQKQTMSLSSLQQPTISINLIQVIASFLNFQTRYMLNRGTNVYANKIYSHKIIQFDGELYGYLKDQYFSNQIETYTYNNILQLDENQLTFNSDATIGIGNTLRLLSRIMVTEYGPGLFYQCLTNRDYSYLYENGQSAVTESPQQFSYFLKQLLRMFQIGILQQPNQVEMIFQFLALGINQSYYFAQQLLQTHMLSRIRRIIKQIINACDNENDLAIVNKILLFTLALSQYRESHQQQVQSFMRLPQSLIQQILIKFATVFQRYHRIVGNIQPQSILSNFYCHKKMALTTLYKGSIHICLKLLRKYYLIQSLQQNISYIQTIVKLSHDIIWVPPKPNLHNIQNLPIKNININKLKVNPNQQICIIQQQINNTIKYKYKQLAQFIGYISIINKQYGRNYQIYVIQIYDKMMSNQHMRDNKINKYILELYRINYCIGLENCHQLLVSAFMAYIINIQCTGNFAHLLSFTVQDNMLVEHRNKQRIQSRNWLNIKNNVMQIKNTYKYQAKQQLSGSYFWGHDFQQSYRTKISLIRTLIDYFQKHHNWQHSNDIIIYTITLMLQNLSQYWQLSTAFINQYKKLLSFILDSIQIQFRISPLIFSLLYYTLIKCMTCCQQLFTSSLKDIQNIVQKISQMILYGGNIVSIQVQYRINNTIYNQRNLQQNIYIICYIYSTIISGCPQYNKYNNRIYREYQNPQYKYSIQMIIEVLDYIIDKYLTNYHNLDINNMAIMSLINQVLTICTNMENKQNIVMHQQTNNRIIKIINKFIKFITKALDLHKDSLFNGFLIQSLANLHQQAEYYDVQCLNTVMELANTYIDTRKIKGVQINHNKYNEYNEHNKYNQYDKYNEYENTSKKGKITPQNIYNNNYYFTQLLCMNKSNINNITLTNIIQIKQLLLLLTSICNRQIYWQNQKYSYIVQTIFTNIINQQFIYKFLQGIRQTNIQLLYCRISPQNISEQHLSQIIISQQYDIYQRKQNIWDTDMKINTNMKSSSIDRIIQKKQHKQINMFEFIVHIQMCHSMRLYIQCMMLGLKYSQSLRSYYSKMLSSGTNNIDEMIWQKISTTLYSIIQYINDVWINLIRFYPKTLMNLLVMYRFCRNNTDIGYQMDFLNVCFGNAGVSDYIDANLMVQFKGFILDFALSACNCSLQFIQVWKANDWKTTVDWVESRNKFMYQISNFLKKCEDYLKTQTNTENAYQMTNQLHSLRRWFESAKPK